MAIKAWGLAGLLGIQFVFSIATIHAQVAMPDKEQMAEIQESGMLIAEIFQLSMNATAGAKLELSVDQRRKLAITSQKYQEEMLKMQQGNQGGKFDMKAYRKITDAMMKEAKEILSDKQMKQLKDAAKERQKKQGAMMSDPDKVKEMQKLSRTMVELQRLSYDTKLSAELELTSEQRIDIRLAQQKYNTTMQEMMRDNNGGSMDMTRYYQIMEDLMLEAQAILTPEQSEKLSRLAKLKQLKQQFGDEFAMVNGLIADFELSPQETKDVREAIKEARESYYSKLKELKDDTLKSIVDAMPYKHREEVREAVETFLDTDPRKSTNQFGATVVPVGR